MNKNNDALIEESLQNDKSETVKAEFKKPILVGKIGRIPRKLVKQAEEKETTQAETCPQETCPEETNLTVSEDKKVVDVESEYNDMM